MYEPAVTKMMGSSTNDIAGTPLRDKTDMVGLRKFAMRQPFSSDDILDTMVFYITFLTCFPASVFLIESRWQGPRLGLESGQMHM